MKSRRHKRIDILAAGELLIDFISTDFTDKLDEASLFRRLPGGSPANLCMNMARLGNKVTLVASVGNDDMGLYLANFVTSQGVDIHHLRRVDTPTTLILVTRSQHVSNFAAYRGADYCISQEQFPEHLLDDISIFHTTCFALSREPASSVIMASARKAAARGCQLSIDANYASKIWPEQQEARGIVEEYAAMGAIIKISEVDWERLYDAPLAKPEHTCRHFLQLGARTVCLTLGAEGAYVADQAQIYRLKGRQVEVKDTTGAGDAFWSGFLTAWLDGHSLEGCAHAGRRMAEIKLEHFGPLSSRIERGLIYSD